MRYACLASDYDGTLAQDGAVAASTLKALEQVALSGRKLILLTGRELPDLQRVFPRLDIFDRIVAENGALLYRPASKEEVELGERPPQLFVEELRRRGVSPLSVGRSIVATWHPFESVVIEVIHNLGLELQVVFNKGAVMVLPSGVNKRSGLVAALEELRLSPHNTVGLGDAENDHALLSFCECGVAVANAVPMLKERADFVTAGDHGAGAEELIRMLLADDLRHLRSRQKPHRILLGKDDRGEEFCLDANGSRLLIAGASGSGKSSTVTAILERLIERRYQVCLIDPEGDYEGLESLVGLGGPNRLPGVSEILEVLDNPENSVAIKLLAIPLPDRPFRFMQLLQQLQQWGTLRGRPHWIVIDEAHQLLSPTPGLPAPSSLKEFASTALITVHPDHIAHAVLKSVSQVIVVGTGPEALISQFNSASERALELTAPPDRALESGEVLVWSVADPSRPVRVAVQAAKVERLRHRRKYASGELGPDKSFYFRGASGKLNLRAQNLNVFVQLAEGIDDETWMHHLRSGHYSAWLRNSIKDESLAAATEKIEAAPEVEPAESRSRIIRLIQERYTASE
jgi:HAD superfamily hydrolase (TIGR01484 family)